MTGSGDELAELLWDHGPALRRPAPASPPPFQPFSCSAAGSSRAHELKRHAAAASKPPAFALPAPLDRMLLLPHDAGPPLGLPAVHDDAVPAWLHCPVVVDDADADADDTAPLPPDYCTSLLPAEYPAVPPEAPAAPANKQAAPAPAEGVINFTFFSRPLQRPQPSSHPVEPTPAAQAAATTTANRLRSTPLFSEQRMAWLQPPKAPRAGAAMAAVVAPPPAPPPPPTTTTMTQSPLAPPPDGRCRGGVVAEAGTVTTPTPHGIQHPEAARAAGPDAVTTSSVCSGNGDRSQQADNKRSGSSSLHHHADCSVSLSQDELDLDVDEGGATRRSSSAAAARSSKRSRTAEVHNLSERRRRDRINEKMRALQELIPNCNKIDKASMLEEAIEYLKTLQLQVQMMSMGTPALCVPPMLLPHPHAMAALPHPMAQYAHAHFPPHHYLAAMGLGFAAFDMLPRAVPAAHFPCPPMPMPAAPPGPIFGGVPSPAAMFAHAAAAVPGTGSGAAAGAALPEQMEAAAAPGPAPAPSRPGAEHPPVPAAAAQGQNGSGRELQRPAVEQA